MAEYFDFLIIGSGIAGLTFALKVADTGTVAIVTKKEDTESSTNYAQGGIAAVFASDDSFEKHTYDTMKAGAGLSHYDAVETIVREGPVRVRELFELGVEFTTKANSGDFDLGREGGHEVNRIVHAKDFTGQAVEKALVENCKSHRNIRFFEDHLALDLLLDSRKRSCLGAVVMSPLERKLKNFYAKATLLCTGGSGQVYPHTTNPSIATGDGLAMSYRAGAVLGNLEFMQFHPTSLYHPKARSFLISEAVRGFGGILRNTGGERFMERYHRDKELAPRDVVAWAIDTEMKRRGEPCMFLDVTHIEAGRLTDRFPKIYAQCLRHNIDITRDLIPVVPAAHYICGGVLTDLYGRTSLKRLFASGEVAMTGVHGANRLASNSLLEAVVFSHRAAEKARELVRDFKSRRSYTSENAKEAVTDSDEILITHDRREIQNLMWDYVGIVRSLMRLQRAQERIKTISKDVEDFYRANPLTESLVELRNIATVAGLIVKCAVHRRESRGLHILVDHPDRDDANWKRDTIVTKRGIE